MRIACSPLQCGRGHRLFSRVVAGSVDPRASPFVNWHLRIHTKSSGGADVGGVFERARIAGLLTHPTSCLSHAAFVGRFVLMGDDRNKVNSPICRDRLGTRGRSSGHGPRRFEHASGVTAILEAYRHVSAPGSRRAG